jgi:hypothetical protein
MSDEELRRLLAQGTEVRPDERRLAQIRTVLISRMQPVRPLPSNPVLIGVALASFALICLLATLYGGHKGWHVLNPFQTIVYFGAFLSLAILFSIAIVEQIIPGARRRARPGWLIAGTALFLIALVPVLFERFGLNRFVAHGVPCLEFGTECAAIGGALGFFLIRKGFPTSPLQTAVLAGCFAGLAGATALAFVCPQLNAPHILVWHFGTIAIGTGAGALIGRMVEWRTAQNTN